MGDGTEELHGLIELGLTRYEARAYLTLVLRESYSAGELATETGIPRQRIYDVLANLVTRGLARERRGAVNEFAAVDPLTAVDMLLASKQHDLDALGRQAALLAERMRDSWIGGQMQ